MCPPSSYLLAFDLEIAKIIPDGTEDWSQYRPYGISVAATLTDDGGLRLWHGGPGPDGNPWPQMSSMQAQVFVRYLLRMVGQGYTIVTWNGLGFDFDVLAEESGLYEECKALALGHIDPMFHLFCEKGFPLSLNKAAHGMGLQGKTEGMNGALAPVLWAEGHPGTWLSLLDQPLGMAADLATGSRAVADRARGDGSPATRYGLDDRPVAQGKVYRMAKTKF